MPTKKNLEASKTSGNSPTSRTDLISKTTPDISEELLTPEELAAKLKLPPATIYELTRKRTAGSRKPLPKLKVGKFLRFRLSEVYAWMEANRAAA